MQDRNSWLGSIKSEKDLSVVIDNKLNMNQLGETTSRSTNITLAWAALEEAFIK